MIAKKRFFLVEHSTNRNELVGGQRFSIFVQCPHHYRVTWIEYVETIPDAAVRILAEAGAPLHLAPLFVQDFLTKPFVGTLRIGERDLAEWLASFETCP